VRARSKKEAEQVGKYMIRPILSLKRRSFDEDQGQVIYQYGKPIQSFSGGFSVS